jgi:hypothetical protein
MQAARAGAVLTTPLPDPPLNSVGFAADPKTVPPCALVLVRLEKKALFAVNY